MLFREYFCPNTKQADGIPYCMLEYIKNLIEIFFKLVSYFIGLSLLVGVTLTACPKNLFLQFLPLLVGGFFFLYIVITFITTPAFIATEKIKSVSTKRMLRFIILVFSVWLAYYLLDNASIFELLDTYVMKLFPHAKECQDGLLTL